MKQTEKSKIESIKALKTEIEHKITWGAGNVWSQQHYEELSERIKNETGVLLSINTLKRFFGKIKSNSTPGKTTLNTLSRFCGYESFYDFSEKAGRPVITEDKPLKVFNFIFNWKLWKVALILLLIVIVAVITVIVIRSIKKQQYFESARFSQFFESGFVPFTQIFRYNVNQKLADTIYFNEYYKGAISLSTHDSVFSWMHFVPGFRKVRFVANNRTLWENSYMVKTKGWLFIFPWGGLEPRKYINLETDKNYLTVSKELLAENKIDLEEDGGWVHYFNAKYFGAKGDNFMLETTVRNALKTGFQQCQDVIISIECQTFEFSVHFTQTGCQKFAELKVGDDLYGGIQNDLTKLTFNMEEWQNITMKSKDGKFAVFNNDNLLIEKECSGTPGEITMIHYSFRGNGMVDDILLTDENNKQVYFEDFE